MIAADRVLDGDWDPKGYFSTGNIGEAVPGVMTPLGWTTWGPACERGVRSGLHAIGALTREESGMPANEADRLTAIFYGYAATRADFFCMLGDRMPGTTGEAVATQLLGDVPPDFVASPTRRRYAAIAAKLPAVFARIPARTRKARRRTHEWWTNEIARSPGLDLDGARRQFFDAAGLFETNIRMQTISLLAGVQPMMDQVIVLAEKSGDPSLAGRLLTGQGSHDEMHMVNDLWELSRGRIELSSFLADHGYHGPEEGQINATVWREDPAPLLAVAEQYAAAPEEERPTALAEKREAERGEAERELMDRLPVSRRAGARLTLRLANTYVPLRGVAKTTFLQSLDVARAGARRCGELLAAGGVLGDREDVFYLTAEELSGELAGGVSELIEERREQRRHYLGLELPKVWQGRPRVIEEGDAPPDQDGLTLLKGIGTSSGSVEGVVHVVTDPAAIDFEPGSILVSATTDPSWASVLLVADALVVDIGGQLSHAAVVARELGIPCVVNTGNGTSVLNTGDRVRVDGSSGEVEILARAERTGA